MLLRGLLLVALLLPLGLVGCAGPGQPPRSVLLDALALQIQLTQGSIAQALELEPPGLPQVSRVRVEEQQAVSIGDARGLRLAGRFDWRLAADPIRVDSPFELFLARGERGQTWRLARPLGADANASVIPSALSGAAGDRAGMELQAVAPVGEPAEGSGLLAESPRSERGGLRQDWITYPLPLPGQPDRG